MYNEFEGGYFLDSDNNVDFISLVVFPYLQF